MENKKTYKFGIEDDSFFLEKRLVFEDPPKEEKPAVKSGSEEKEPGAGGEPKPERQEAEAEVRREKAGIETKIDTSKDRVLARTVVETSDLQAQIEKEKKLILENMLANLDEWKISILRRSKKINPDKWDFTSKEGLDLIKREWSILGITKGNAPFYETKLFPLLSRSFDRSFLDQIDPSNKTVINAYRDPIGNLDNLGDKTGDGAYAASVDFFVAIKKIVTDQDLFQGKTEKGLQEKNQDPIFGEGTRIVRENIAKFKDAIKTRDYATAAVYVVGLWAMWKSYKSLPKDSQEKYSKYLFWGAALYAGNLFAKNAGIDIMKKLGFKDADAEVKGTPLAVLSRLDIPGAKDVDYTVFRDISFVNISDLYSKYKETNDPRIQFIDPNQFPEAFRDKKFEGLHPNDLKKSTALSPKEKEYQRVGHELYKIVQALKEAFEKTMRPYYKKSFEEALRDGVLKYSTVFDFMVALNSYAPEYRESKSIADLGGSDKVKERLTEVFKDTHLGFEIDSGPEKPDLFKGTIMDYPVIIKRDSLHKQLIVFAKSDYDTAGGTPHVSLALATIPFTGNASGSVNTLKKEITTRMGNLTTMFVSNSKDTVALSEMEYHSDGYWYALLTYQRGNLLRGDQKPIQVRIRPGDGKSLTVTNLEGEILIHVEDVLNKGKLYGNLVLAQLVNQDASKGTDFTALSWMYRNKKLTFTDQDVSDKKFGLRIGDVNIDGSPTIEIEFDETKGYKFAKDDTEKKLLENHTFRHEMSESIGEDPKFKKSTQELKDLVEETPESYFIHLFQNIPSWFTQASWSNIFSGVDLSHFTGSVPKNHMLALIDAQKSLVLSNFELSFDKSTKLSDVAKNINSTISPAIDDFNRLIEKFSALNTKKADENTDWSKEDFDDSILLDLTSIGIEGRDYKVWYRKFINSVLAKYGTDDLRSGKASKAAQLIRIFAYYTAPLNSSKFDDAPLSKSTDPKTTGYRLSAKYAEYVAGMMFRRLNQGRVADQIPDPGNFWDIVPYSEFEKNPQAYLSSHEFIDTRTTLKMSKEYTTFDDWLKMDDATRKTIPDDMIILPRKSVTLQLSAPATPRRNEENKILAKLIAGRVPTGVPNQHAVYTEKLKLTDYEEEFRKKLYEAVEYLKKKYSTRVHADAFQEFLSSYSPAYQIDSNPAKNEIKLTYGRHYSSGPKGIPKFVDKHPDMSLEISDLESYFVTGGTVTLGDQLHSINTKVESIIQGKILAPQYFGRYFKKTGFARGAKEVWEDFKDWVWGLTN